MDVLIDPDQDIDDRPDQVGADDSACGIDASQLKEGLLDIKSPREEKGQEREPKNATAMIAWKMSSGRRELKKPSTVRR